MDEKINDKVNDRAWLKDELTKIASPNEYESLPSLKLQPNIVVEIRMDLSKPWSDWKEKDDKGAVITHKKIIPVYVKDKDGKEQKLHWWVNVKNPIYREIVQACVNNQLTIKILQTGTANKTRYNLVK